MDGKIVFRILAALVLLAAIAGVAYFAFNVGVATRIQAPTSGTGPVPYAYPYYGFWHPFFGFGCFGPLIGLLLLFLAFRAFGFLFWGPRWGYGRHLHHGWRHGWDEEGGVPPIIRQWHDRLHGQTAQSDETRKD